MTVEEIGHLCNAVKNVNELKRITECNTIDRVLEIIDSHITLAQEMGCNIFALYNIFILRFSSLINRKKCRLNV